MAAQSGKQETSQPTNGTSCTESLYLPLIKTFTNHCDWDKCSM